MIRSFLFLIRTTYGLYFILLLVFFFFLKTKGSSDHNLREAQGRGYQPQEPRMESEAKASLYGKVEGCLVQRKYQWKKNGSHVCRWLVDYHRHGMLIEVKTQFLFLCPHLYTVEIWSCAPGWRLGLTLVFLGYSQITKNILQSWLVVKSFISVSYFFISNKISSPLL